MRAKPKFTFSLLAAAVALALPGTGYALGLGKLTVNSALGQPLSAQIELTSAAREELDSLAARVADPSIYRQNNLPYPGVLSRARVTVERDPSGTPYLKVTTPAPVNEPYLDLLVEINWASGRVVRDYTFLLDPPGATMLAQPVEPVAPARVGAAPARPAPAAAAPASATAPTPAPVAGGGETYTVKRGDTLSKIANDYRAPSATLDQMLVALFKSNADAFDGKNMNRLRTGAIITIPSADDVSSTPAPEATQVVRVQASDWRAYRDRVAAAAPVAEGAGGRAASGRIGTAVEEKTPAAPPGRDQVRISKDAGTGAGAGVAEEAVARDKALREANTRIAALEKTIQDMQRAIELKSQAGAQAQAQAEAAKAKAAPPPPPSPITKAPEPAVVAKAPEPPKVEPPKVEPPKAAEPVKAPEPPKAEPPKVEPPKAAEAPKVEPPKAAEPAKAPEPPKAEPPKAAPKLAPTPTKEPPGFFEDMMANTPTWAVAGGALAILGGIAALVAARRRKTTKFEDSIISGTDIKTNTVFGSTGGGVVNTGDNSLASDFSREGLGNIDTDEVDPIAEAEVYLAYGRDAQAEEILKEALKKDPHRQEIYLKLLEIHAQHNKPSAFETVAAELYSVSQGQGETWQKAVGLGRQLDPNNPMFAEGGSGAAVAAAAAAAGAAVVAAAKEPAAHVEPAIRHEPPRAAPIPADVATDMGDTGGGLDFKLDEEISISPSSGAGAKAAKAKSPIDILAGAEAELGKTARSAAAALHEGVVDTTRPAPAPVLHDMEFTLDASEKPAPIRPQAPRPEPVLTAVSHGPAPHAHVAAPGSGAAPSLARPQAAIDLDKLELSFDPEKAHYEDPTPSVLDGQWHDAATKLDLAKAYQEMGDVEGAREILQEVLHEGDDQQKTEAQSLISKLG